jgi:hypothetical protein
MYTDDEDFEEIYQSLTPGLVIVYGGPHCQDHFLAAIS